MPDSSQSEIQPMMRQPPRSDSNRFATLVPINADSLLRGPVAPLPQPPGIGFAPSLLSESSDGVAAKFPVCRRHARRRLQSMHMKSTA